MSNRPQIGEGLNAPAGKLSSTNQRVVSAEVTTAAGTTTQSLYDPEGH